MCPKAFAHEVNLLDDLYHDNIVDIIGFVEDVKHGIAWMVFFWEKNGNLREFVRSADWELPERVSLVSKICFIPFAFPRLRSSRYTALPRG